MQKNSIEIAPKTIIFFLSVIAALFVGLKVLPILIQLVIAFMIMTALHPAVQKLQKIGLSRIPALFLVYILMLSLLSLLFFLIVPPLAEQTMSLVNRFDLPHLPIFDELKNIQFSLDEVTNLWNQYASSIGNIFSFATSTFSVVFSFFTVLVMSFYFLLERSHLHRYIQFLFFEKSEERSQSCVDHIERALGSWVRGELFLMLSIGLLTFVGLSIIGLPYALPLAMIAGLLEVLPNLGPTIAAVPALFIALVVFSPLHALLVAGIYWIIQLFENNILVPYVMKQAVGINPLTSIILILAGFHFGGVMGALLVIPLYIVTAVLRKEFSPEIKKIFDR